jgi:hypothetical protein
LLLGCKCKYHQIEQRRDGIQDKHGYEGLVNMLGSRKPRCPHQLCKRSRLQLR